MTVDGAKFELSSALGGFRTAVSRATTEQHLQLLWDAQDGLLPETQPKPATKTPVARVLVGAAAVAVALVVGASVTTSQSEPIVAINATLEEIDGPSLATPSGDDSELPLLAIPADEELAPDPQPSTSVVNPGDPAEFSDDPQQTHQGDGQPDDGPDQVSTSVTAVSDKNPVRGPESPTTNPPAPPAQGPNGPPPTTPTTSQPTVPSTGLPPTDPASSPSTTVPPTTPEPTSEPQGRPPEEPGPPGGQGPPDGQGPANPDGPKADPKADECAGQSATILGTAGDDTIVGTAGPDVIVAGNGNDIIYGLGGDDIVCAGNGNDLIYGGDGDDQLFGENGNDLLYGDDGDDLLDPGRGKAKSK